MIEVILVIYFNSRSCLDATAEENISAYKKAKKYASLTLIFDKFFWGLPQTPTPRGHLDCQVLRAPQYLNPALVCTAGSEKVMIISREIIFTEFQPI